MQTGGAADRTANFPIHGLALPPEPNPNFQAAVGCYPVKISTSLFQTVVKMQNIQLKTNVIINVNKLPLE